MKIRWKAKYPRGHMYYYTEPLTVQHVVDRWIEIFTRLPGNIRFIFRYYTNKDFRLELARNYNRALFGNIPTEQIFVPDQHDPLGGYRPLRPEERTWPE